MDGFEVLVGVTVDTHAEQRVQVATGDAIEYVVSELNRMHRAATLDFALAVGKLVIETFYDNTLDGWRERGAKHASFRKLSRHPDLPMSASGLYRCVALYELCKRMGVTRWAHLTATHLRQVLPLDPTAQAELLNQAEVNRWSVRRLQLAVDEQKSRDGATARAGSLATYRVLNEATRKLETCLFDRTELTMAKRESSRDLRELRALLVRLRGVCTRLERQLEVVPSEPSVQIDDVAHVDLDDECAVT